MLISSLEELEQQKQGACSGVLVLRSRPHSCDPLGRTLCCYHCCCWYSCLTFEKMCPDGNIGPTHANLASVRACFSALPAAGSLFLSPFQFSCVCRTSCISTTLAARESGKCTFSFPTSPHIQAGEMVAERAKVASTDGYYYHSYLKPSWKELPATSP